MVSEVSTRSCSVWTTGGQCQGSVRGRVVYEPREVSVVAGVSKR